jgi:oligopeptide/dipeptide ABC transporter ATP-binding protein
MASPETLLSVERLEVQFETPRGLLHAVNGVSFNVRRGEIYGIVGESGSGKSVTAMSIIRLLPSYARIHEGKIIFNERDLLKLDESEIRAIRGKEVAMIFQDPQTSFDPLFTIANQIGEAVRIHRKIGSRELNEQIVRLLNDVGIPEPDIRKDQYPHQFSGGMKQRAMCAMALSNSPEMIIADEPTTALDVTIQAQVMEMFKDLSRNAGLSILLITHDMGLIAETCDRVSVMYAGFVIETAGVFELFKRPRHPYTRGLIESIPRLDKEEETLTSIPGRAPNPLLLPPFCMFKERCAFSTDWCSESIPQLLEVEEDHWVACCRVQKREI